MTDSHSSLVLAAVQMNSHEILDDNLEAARGLIIEAAARGADVIGLPENFSLMAETNEQRQDAARRVAEVEAFLSEMAKAQGVVIIGGSTPFPAADGLVTKLLFDV
jgi:nitrilase